MTIKQAKELIGAKLITEIGKLPAEEQIPVDYPKSVTSYKLNHPKAALLIVYTGSEFQKTKNGAGVILQDRDMQIGVVVVARKTEFLKQPEEYIDFVHDSLSGLEVEELSGRPDRKVYAIKDEWLDEEDGIWRYASTFVVPTEFCETTYRV